MFRWRQVYTHKDNVITHVDSIVMEPLSFGDGFQEVKLYDEDSNGSHISKVVDGTTIHRIKTHDSREQLRARRMDVVSCREDSSGREDLDATCK